jgi:pSer/pThr/pTyr-binding forkhead associated (FHA) protein
LKTYVVGRSPFADIVIADPSVAEYHAEIVMADDGRIFVGDCGTGSGTWRRASKGERTAWKPLRQAFVRRDDVLRLGDYERSVSDVLAPVAPQPSPGGRDQIRRDAGRPGGRLSRDPTTGEVVRRRS